MARFLDDRQVFLHRIIHKQADHILPGHHDLPGHPVRKVKDIIDQPAFHRVDAAALFAGTDHFPQIIFGMAGAGMDRFNSHKMEQPPPQMIKDIGKRI